jgi:hypothetical protein
MTATPLDGASDTPAAPPVSLIEPFARLKRPIGALAAIKRTLELPRRKATSPDFETSCSMVVEPLRPRGRVDRTFTKIDVR